jgi:hypothetical protein
MSNWEYVDANGTDEWHFFAGSGDGILWSEPGPTWTFQYAPGAVRTTAQHQLETSGSLDDAKREAEQIARDADQDYARESERERNEARSDRHAAKALLIPADPSRPVELIEINGRDDVRQHVGGLPEATRYDHDSLMYVSDTGRIDGQPMNLRATNYIRVESDAAWERGGQLTDDPTYGLYGNVVAVGASGDGLRDLPDRLIERFARSREVSRGDKIRDAFRDRNEDGMIRFPWLKDRSKSHVSPSHNWKAEKVDGRTVYYRTQGEGVVWKDHGSWMMDYALDPQSPTIHAELGRTRSVEKALNRADLTIMNAQVEVHQSYEDVRNVVNLAKEVEDRTPQEQASIDRLQEAIDQGPPAGALDPAEDWLTAFNEETQEREQQRDQDQGREA